MHTPGKWWAIPYSSVVGCAVMAQPDPTQNAFLVAAIPPRGSREETESNARLVATATQLLGAAELALTILRDIAIADSGDPEQDAAEREAFEELEKAVKAAGGQA